MAMAKLSGLGASFFVGAYDLSGDVGAVSSIDISRAQQDVTGLDKDGTERLQLRSDGSLAYDAFFNPDAARSVAILKQLTDQVVTFAVGDMAFSLAARVVDFKTARGQDGSLAISGQALAAFGTTVEIGTVLTLGSHKKTFASTQLVAAWQANHSYSLNALVQPVTPNGHYYKATTGGTSDISEPTFPTNGSTVAETPDTLVWTDQGLLPNGHDRGSGSASSAGLAAYLHVLSIGSGSATVKIQDSSDRIAWSDVTGATFTVVSAATAQRIQTGTSVSVARYVRAYLTGTFTNLVASVSVKPY